MIKAAIISNSEILSIGLSDIFKNNKNISISAIFDTIEACIDACEVKNFDAVIVDCQVPRKRLMQGDVSVCLEDIRKLADMTGVITFADAATFSRYSMALRAGIRGFCLTTISAEDIEKAVKVVANGGSYMHAEYEKMLGGDKGTLINYSLSDRQQAVLSLMLLGLSNREIAEKLFLSTETVKSHIRAILQKLDVRDRTQAVSKVLREMARDSAYNDINSDVFLPVINVLSKQERDTIQ